MATSSILEKHVTAPFLLQRINEASDIFSLGKILFKVGVKQNIPLLVSMAQECLDASPNNCFGGLRLSVNSSASWRNCFQSIQKPKFFF